MADIDQSDHHADSFEPYVDDAQSVRQMVTFFQRPAFQRLLQMLRQKYVERGAIEGQVVLTASLPEERREIASFLGKPLYATDTMRIKLRDVEAALRQSRFQCSLVDVLQAMFPEQPLITRPQQRLKRSHRQEQFRQQLQALLASQAEWQQGYRWLLQGNHGLAWLFSQHKNAPAEEQQRQLASIQTVLLALNRLPEATSPQRLAIFAQRLTGDPHCLDVGRPAGRLFLMALNDLTDPPLDAAFQGRAMELQLYHNAHLLVDTISSSVAVFNLAHAVDLDDKSDPLLEAAGARILLLPLAQLLRWRRITPTAPTIYLIENPQVFEEVVANLADSPESRAPTVICTSGWPGMAVMKLLTLLAQDASDRHFYYSGDFDLKGLQIASYLQDAYPQHCRFWHFDPQDYAMALGTGEGIVASSDELQQLQLLSERFGSLIEQMRMIGRWAYQEGIVSLLISDCCLT
ncbi:TIGR02679 family protein [Dictyobacter kobayashii]|uniref:TIGR02679 family protein n=1 Tax=Dictyobacter kobayashii TaxID=2014872 RepID=A0A402ADG5_9CHLR|nr:TIGR02679 family protein [Dictyobacter kobayashii]GCE17144.1 hypothetical protein KDK_09440 [Dictyobacter kobayashii]